MSRCATLSEFLRQAPEFLSFGEQSDSTLTLLGQPTPGDVLTLSTRFGVPIVVETYVAGTHFTIGGSVADTAANIAVALNGGALVAASSSGAVVSTLSSAGPLGSLALTSSNEAAMLWDEPTMSPGDGQVLFALECACAQINVECWGAKAMCAHIYLTAHTLMVQSGSTFAGGAIASKTMDKLSISYAVTAPSDGDLGATKWGRLYMQLKKTIPVFPIVGRGFLCG